MSFAKGARVWHEMKTDTMTKCGFEGPAGMGLTIEATKTNAWPACPQCALGLSDVNLALIKAEKASKLGR